MSKKTRAEAEEVKAEKTENTAEEEIIKEEAAQAAEEKTEEAAAEEKTEEAATEETAEQPEEKAKDPAIQAMNDKYLRLCAEYDNYRKRSQKEKDALYGDIKANTVKTFLPVYDNLVRALAQSTEDEAYKKGVEMIMSQFKATMEKLGVTEMDCLGKTFDPAFHNAVMHVDDGEKGENEIVEVFQQGFMLGDKVIRFAMVKVAN